MIYFFLKFTFLVNTPYNMLTPAQRKLIKQLKNTDLANLSQKELEAARNMLK